MDYHALLREYLGLSVPNVYQIHYCNISAHVKSRVCYHFVNLSSSGVHMGPLIIYHHFLVHIDSNMLKIITIVPNLLVT